MKSKTHINWISVCTDFNKQIKEAGKGKSVKLNMKLTEQHFFEALRYVGEYYTTYKLSPATFHDKTLNLCKDNDKIAQTVFSMLMLFNYKARSGIVRPLGGSFIKGPSVSPLVPFLPCAVKNATGLPYSEWSPIADNFGTVLANCINDARRSNIEEEWLSFLTSENSSQARRESFYVPGSGYTPSAFASRRQRMSDSWKGYENVLELFNQSSPHLRCMLLQNWVAHPNVRTSEMVLNPWNLDSMPPAIAEQSVEEELEAEDSAVELPWNEEKVLEEESLPWNG